MDLPMWDFPLHSPPCIIYTGVGRHGHEKQSQLYRVAGQWTLHLYRYQGWLHLGGKKFPIDDGSIALVPPNYAFRHSWKHAQSVHFFSLFRLKSKAKESRVKVPLLSELGMDLDDSFQQLSNSSVFFLTQPARAEACLWHYLWKIFGPSSASRRSDPELHPALIFCKQQMEQQPLATTKVNRLASQAGISHNQLIHLFHQHLGMSPQNYLMEQRWKLVRTLLQSTTLPPKRIALDLEFSDLSHFNKFVRTCSGKSPRKFRDQV